ncbi:uncharacterized protein LOC130495673, partial [Raphanus sativus]|uniref:Uncharacterized protein LOC130495673 n=1 Tax=Raphanus sativus TaxID=3726 RepID=A0A9W3BUQ9_RAPSA
TAYSTVAVIGIPRSILPRDPVISMILPSCDHSSNQKEVLAPLRISIRVRELARFLAWPEKC